MLGLLFSMVVTLLPVVIYQFLMVKMGRMLTDTHRNCTYILVFYVWAVFILKGIGSVYDISALGGLRASIDQANICWIPFQEGVIKTAVLNVLLFLPLGFGLPHVWLNFRSALKVTVVGAALSGLVELAQIPTQHSVDLEDFLMNILGTVLGYLFWKHIGNYVFQGHVSRRIVALSNNEPLVYIMMGFICQFFFFSWRWFI